VSDKVTDEPALDLVESPSHPLTRSPPHGRAVFIDRDGVLNAVPGLGWSPRRPEELVLLPGVLEALGRLRDAGWRTVVVSNQPGIAKGQMTEADHRAIARRLEDELRGAGVPPAGCYYCLHHPDPEQVVDQRYLARCDCRKPAPGLLRQAAAALDLDLSACWMIGDAWRDIEAGAAAGCRTLAVGAHERWLETRATAPEAVLNGLTEAVDYLLKESQ
jgi:D-glycero-D-manno-heptose 1,7-bisphosphate phosphatase